MRRARTSMKRRIPYEREETKGSMRRRIPYGRKEMLMGGENSP